MKICMMKKVKTNCWSRGITTRHRMVNRLSHVSQEETLRQHKVIKNKVLKKVLLGLRLAVVNMQTIRH